VKISRGGKKEVKAGGQGGQGGEAPRARFLTVLKLIFLYVKTLNCKSQNSQVKGQSCEQDHEVTYLLQ
jgi:hypothetical protein